MATLKDIAALAGVSQGTVSNVLNDRGNVSSQKIQLVMDAAKALGYNINERAKFLRKGTSNILAIVLPDITSCSYRGIYYSFKQYAEENSYKVSLYLTDDIPSRETQLISQLRSDMIAGVVSISCLSDSYQSYLDTGFLPNELLFLEREPNDTCNFLGFDYRKAGQAMAQLASRDSQTISVFMKANSFSPENHFLEGFCQSLSEDLSNRLKITRVNPVKQQQDMITFLSDLHSDTELFTGNFSLAELLRVTGKNFFPEKKLSVIRTISPLTVLPDYTYKRYELDYKHLGHDACARLICQLTEPEQPIIHRMIPGSGFRDWSIPSISGKSSKSLNLLMQNGPEIFAVQSLAKIYTQQTGTKIRIAAYSYDEIFQILSNNSVEAFDILRINNTFLTWFAPKLLTPLSELSPDIDLLLGEFLSVVSRRYSTVQGVVYALPYSPSVQLLFYRKDLFENSVQKRLYKEKYREELSPPRTFAQFNQIAEFFTRKVTPTSPVEYGASLTLGNIGTASSEYMARFQEYYDNLYDPNGRVCLNCSSGQKAMQQMIDLIPFTPNIPNCDWTDTAKYFANGNLAMAILYSNYASDLFRGSNELSSKIGCTLVPGNNRLLGGASLGIYRGSSKKEDAFRFIQWLTKETVASAITFLGGSSPCRKTYENYEILNIYPWLKLVPESISSSKEHKQSLDQSMLFSERKFLNIIGMAVKNACDQIQTPEEALEWAQKEYEKTLT